MHPLPVVSQWTSSPTPQLVLSNSRWVQININQINITNHQPNKHSSIILSLPCDSQNYFSYHLALLMTHSFCPLRSSQTMVFIRVCSAGSSASLCALIIALWLLMEFSEMATLRSFISFLPVRLDSVEGCTNKIRKVLYSCQLWRQRLISLTKKRYPMGHQLWTQPQGHTAPCLRDFIAAIILWVCMRRHQYTSWPQKATSQSHNMHLHRPIFCW